MFTSMQIVREQIHRHVRENFLFDDGDVGDDTSLLDEGIIDSMSVLELVLFVEEHFGVAVAEREVVPDNFDSVNALVAFVACKLGAVPVRLAS